VLRVHLFNENAELREICFPANEYFEILKLKKQKILFYFLNLVSATKPTFAETQTLASYNARDL
jgi:hypothetical protein